MHRWQTGNFYDMSLQIGGKIEFAEGLLVLPAALSYNDELGRGAPRRISAPDMDQQRMILAGSIVEIATKYEVLPRRSASSSLISPVCSSGDANGWTCTGCIWARSTTPNTRLGASIGVLDE
jgi:hypothetical protein